MLWPLNPSGMKSVSSTQAILGRLRTLRAALGDDIRLLDRGCITRPSTGFLESSEADVVGSESTDSSDEFVSQSSMMASCGHPCSVLQPLELHAIGGVIR